MRTVTCSVLYIWTHSKPAYWKLFMKTDMSQKLSFVATYFEIVYMSYCSFAKFICVIFLISCISLFPFSLFCMFFRIYFSLVFPPLSLHMYGFGPRLGATRPPWFGPAPDQPACADRPCADLLLISRRDEANVALKE